MSFILAFFSNPLFRKIGAAVVFIGGVFLLGVKFAGDRFKTKKLEEAADTNERINDADVGKGDADADREWLRKRGKS